MREYKLDTRYDSRKSFYNKATVTEEGTTSTLTSYTTNVAQIRDGVATVFGTYSPTTLRHIKEFLKQAGFKADTLAQIEQDYM